MSTSASAPRATSRSAFLTEPTAMRTGNFEPVIRWRSAMRRLCQPGIRNCRSKWILKSNSRQSNSGRRRELRVHLCRYLAGKAEHSFRIRSSGQWRRATPGTPKVGESCYVAHGRRRFQRTIAGHARTVVTSGPVSTCPGWFAKQWARYASPSIALAR
jgi:hypothetical protein